MPLKNIRHVAQSFTTSLNEIIYTNLCIWRPEKKRMTQTGEDEYENYELYVHWTFI